MKDDTRMIATAVIWSAFTIIMGLIAAALIFTNAELDTIGIGALLAIVIGLMMTVANSTMAIWGFKPEETEDDKVRRAKSKNIERNRVERLIADLDDDEIYDLEALLLAHDGDGEIPHKQQNQ